VNFATAEARVAAGPELDVDALRAAIDEAGYTLAPIVEGSDVRREREQRETRALRWRAGGAALCTVPVFALAMFGVEGPASRFAQAALTAVVVFGFGARFHRGALVQARHAAADMDTLISLGTLAAFGASAWALLRGGPLYFETAAVIVTLILFGRTLEARARLHTSDALVGLAALGAREACVLRDGREVRVPTESLQPGDELVIRPGEVVPTDAVILEGNSSFDESAFSGEPLPVDKGPGDELFGASVNRHGRVRVEATRVGRDTALARIVRLVEEAQASKAPVQRLADRVAGVFVPVVLGIAALTLVAWWASGSSAASALAAAVAVLVIACPCALGLATPTAILVGSGRGAELGILFKGAEIFECSREIDTVVFDKTGTLTRGAMTLAEVVSDEPDFMRLVASLEDASEHPVARAVAAGAVARGLTFEKVQDFEAKPGRGVSGRIGQRQVWVGTLRWMQELGIELPEDLDRSRAEVEARGRSVLIGAWGGRARGLMAVADQPRPSAARAVARLRALGVRLGLVTGDNRRAAEALARELGIDEVRAEALPEDKAEHIGALQEHGARVAFVGDGINDAPALTQADLGIAIGSGSEVAIQAGGVVLVSGDPELAADALALARRTYRTIAENLFWAFGYNVVALPVAALGLLDPMIAAAAMAFSSLSVVGNSLRLRRFQPR
jgi:heavy metal translocating P-type ATPase